MINAQVVPADQAPEPKRTYPRLKASKLHGYIVYFTRKGKGVVIADPLASGYHPVGKFGDDWAEDAAFEEFEGTVTLNNGD